MHEFVYWPNTKDLYYSLSFTCWNCNNIVSSHCGFHTAIYICPHCRAPHILDAYDNPLLQARPGREVKNLPENVQKIYNEARDCFKVSAFTACAMLLRTMLIHIAYEEGMEDVAEIRRAQFPKAIDYLFDEKHLIPSGLKNVTTRLKDKASNMVHKLEFATKTDTDDLLQVAEALLTCLYEYKEDENHSSNKN